MGDLRRGAWPQTGAQGRCPRESDTQAEIWGMRGSQEKREESRPQAQGGHGQGWNLKVDLGQVREDHLSQIRKLKMNSDVSGGGSGRVCKQESYTSTQAFSEVAVVAVCEDEWFMGRQAQRQRPPAGSYREGRAEGDLACGSDHRRGKKWVSLRDVRGGIHRFRWLKEGEEERKVKQDWPLWLGGAVHWDEEGRSGLGRKIVQFYSGRVCPWTSDQETPS